MEGFKLTFLSYTDPRMAGRLNHGKRRWNRLCKSGDIRPNAKIEQKFNCTLAETQIVYMIETLTANVMGGVDDNFQIAMIYDGKVNMAKVNGLLANWDIMPYTDLSKPWWNKAASECFTLGRRQYGAVGDMCLSMYSKITANFSIPTYITLSGSENLYELVYNKKWTLEKMLQIGENYTKDLNGDGLKYTAATNTE
jgi:hypothetical protein